MICDKNKFPELKVSIFKDIIISFLVSMCIAITWLVIFKWSNASKYIDKNYLTVLGSVIAISGFLFKQYMFSEVISYLNNWIKIQFLVSSILDFIQNDSGNKYYEQFIDIHIQAKKYCSYLKCEILLISKIPLILIFFYGVAVCSGELIILKILCIFLMLNCIVYLSIAAHSSTKIIFENSDIFTTISDLEEIKNSLNDRR